MPSRLGKIFSALSVVWLCVNASASQPLSRCKSTLVSEIEKKSFQSSTFGDLQTLRVWLPPEYHDPQNSNRRYPVLYMMDGENLFDVCTASSVTTQHEWMIDESLTQLIAAGEVEPIIVVGIDSPGNRRADEYIPYADPLFSDGSAPHGAQFPDFMVKEVVPQIARQYRVADGPTHTAIGGSSYGAVAALYTLLHRPDVFGLGLLESTSLQVGNGQLLRDTGSLAVGPRKVSIGVGAQEMTGHEDFAQQRGMSVDGFNKGFVQLSERLSGNLKAAILNQPEVVFYVAPEGQHREQDWALRFPAAIRFLFPKEKGMQR